ncbi:MAG: hypothetical protein ACTS3F_00370 [Phycisphaerales bacterium]
MALNATVLAIDMDALDAAQALPAADLRRREPRDQAEAILALARFVHPRDRALLTAIYEQGHCAAHLAALTHQDPRTIRRRIRHLLTRFRSPLFAFVATHLRQWPPARQRIAVLCILQGLTIRAAAERTGFTMHAVRRHLDQIKLLHELTTRNNDGSR